MLRQTQLHQRQKSTNLDPHPFPGSSLISVVKKFESSSEEEKRESTKEWSDRFPNINWEDEIHVDVSKTGDEESQKQSEEEESEEEDWPEVRLCCSTEIYGIDEELYLSVVMLGLDCGSSALNRRQRRLQI